jgi:hypothetical protein
MYDAALMQSSDAANAAADAANEVTSVIDAVTNSAPVFTMPDNITVITGQVLNLSLHVTDPDGDNLTLTVTSSLSNSSVFLEKDRLVWVTDRWVNATVTLAVTATDSKGAAREWRPVILLCHCDNGGVCDFTYVTDGE